MLWLKSAVSRGLNSTTAGVPGYLTPYAFGKKAPTPQSQYI